ncbi:MAG: hypothetical protein WBO77_00200 [Microgenomates group bacterium]
MAKRNAGIVGMLLAGVAATVAGIFFSKEENRTKTVRVAKKLGKKVVKAEKKLVKKVTAKKTSTAKKAKKKSGTKKK